MNYRVLITRHAQRELAALEPSAVQRLSDAIRRLSSNPRPAGARKLKGREGWRVRVGDYRFLYDIDDAARTVTVLRIGHRREIYR